MKEVDSSDVELELSPKDIDFTLLVKNIRRIIALRSSQIQNIQQNSEPNIDNNSGIISWPKKHDDNFNASNVNGITSQIPIDMQKILYLEQNVDTSNYDTEIKKKVKEALKEAEYQLVAVKEHKPFDDGKALPRVTKENSTSSIDKILQFAPANDITDNDFIDIATSPSPREVIAVAQEQLKKSDNSILNSIEPPSGSEINTPTPAPNSTVKTIKEITDAIDTAIASGNITSSEQIKSPTFNINDFLPRRQLRPRTLKQMKPYLVDRFEHQAQLDGDAKRALLIEKAAAEQNMDLLEQLQEEDRRIRQERMHKTIQKEKSKEFSKKNKKGNKVKRKHIDNSILRDDDSIDEALSSESDMFSINNDGHRSILNDILDSQSSPLGSLDGDMIYKQEDTLENEKEAENASSEESSLDYDSGDEPNNQLSNLKDKLSRYQVLPKSYIRYLKSKEQSKKYDRLSHSSKRRKSPSAQTPRKGLAVRKITKSGLYSTADRGLDFVNDGEESAGEDEVPPNPYVDKNVSDIEQILSKYNFDDDNDNDNDDIHHKMLSHYSNEVTNQSGGKGETEYTQYSDNDGSSGEDSLIETGYKQISQESDLENDSDTSLIIDQSPEDSLEIKNVSDVLEEIPSYQFVNTVDTGSNWNDECEEDRSTGLDRMLGFGVRKKPSSNRKKTTSWHGNNLPQKRPLHRISSNCANLNGSSSRITSKSTSKRLLSSDLKRHKVLTAGKSQKITDFASVANSHTLRFSKALAGDERRKVQEDAEQQRKKKHNKKKKIHNYYKDDHHYEFNRNPHHLTLQLESNSGKFKVPKLRFANQIFDNKPKDNDIFSMEIYNDIFNNTPKALKIYPLSGIHFPDNSLINWFHINSINDPLCMFSKDMSLSAQTRRPYRGESRFTEVETNLLLIYSNVLEYFKLTEEGQLDQFVADLKNLSESITEIEPDKIAVLASGIERFLENAVNILSNKISISSTNSSFCYVILFFPLLQLFILSQIAKAADYKSDYIKLQNKFVKYCRQYFTLLVEGWHPLKLYNVLVNYTDNNSTIIYDALYILRLLNDSSHGSTFWSIINSTFTATLKASNIDQAIDFTLLFANFYQQNESDTSSKQKTNWKVVEFIVHRINEASFASEFELYRHHKSVFNAVALLLREFGWFDSELPFKALVKLLKKRKFVNFPNESLTFKIFNKFHFYEFKRDDTLCNFFIKLVMYSVRKKARKLNDQHYNYSRLVQFFEPNSNVFSDPAKPDVFLQTFINKINIYILNTRISNVSYANGVIKLIKSVIIQDDLACYEKAFEGLACYYAVHKHKLSPARKSAANGVFEDLVVAILKNFNTFIFSNVDRTTADIQMERQYMSLFTTMFQTITDLILSTNEIENAAELYLRSVGVAKIFQLPYFQFIKYCDTLMRLLNTVIKSINKFSVHIKALISSSLDETGIDKFKQVGEKIRDELWNPMLNLIGLAESKDAFIPNTNYNAELVCCFSNVSDLLVCLNYENWQSLNYKWELQSMKQYQLVWLSQVLKHNGRNSIAYDSDYFIEIFASSIIAYKPKDYLFYFFQQLIKNDYLNNKWLSFKTRFDPNISIFEFSHKRLEVLSAFIITIYRNFKNSPTDELRASKILNLMIGKFKEEYEHRRAKDGDTNKHYYEFAKKVLVYLNFPSGKQLLRKSNDFYYLKQAFRITSAITFTGSDLQRKLEQFDDNKEEIFIFIQEQLLSSLANNSQDSFINDLAMSIINLQKDFSYEDEETLDALDSKLYFLVSLITAQVHLIYSKLIGYDLWILLYYTLKALAKILNESGPFGMVDYWILCRLVCQFDPIVGQHATKKQYEYYEIASISLLYSILKDLFHLFAGQEDRLFFESLIELKTNFLEKESFVIPMIYKLLQEKVSQSHYAAYHDRALFLDDEGFSHPLLEHYNSERKGTNPHLSKKVIKKDEFILVLSYPQIQKIGKVIAENLQDVYKKNSQLIKMQNTETSIKKAKLSLFYNYWNFRSLFTSLLIFETESVSVLDKENFVHQQKEKEIKLLKELVQGANSGSNITGENGSISTNYANESRDLAGNLEVEICDLGLMDMIL